jgi:hypothetical protein
VYYTSDRDSVALVALMEELARNPDTPRGRIAFHKSPAYENIAAPKPSPAELNDKPASNVFTKPPSFSKPAFADVASPRRTPPAPIQVSAAASVPAGGFSPKRQMLARQGFMAHRQALSGGSIGSVGSPGSPSAASVATSKSGYSVRSVEERLQALIEKNQDGDGLETDGR